MRISLIALFLALAVSGVSSGQTYTIKTFAGGGLPEGIPALSASLGNVGGVATDARGNTYYALVQYNIILLQDSAGMLRRVAGTGTCGYSGDNGPATNAQLCQPRDVAVDSAGNLYVADSGNDRIRRVSNGVILTVAGGGLSGYGGDNGPATSASLNSPNAVAVDSAGNLYTDDYSNRIRKVSNGVITRFAGGASDGFSENIPATDAHLDTVRDIAVDSIGNLYIALGGTDDRIRKVSNGLITTVAGGGSDIWSENIPATSAYLNDPSAVAVDSTGNLYIADGTIRKVSNGLITTVAGGGSNRTSDNIPATSALFYADRVAVDPAGNLYITVTDGHSSNLSIRKVSNGMITTVAGNGTVGYSGDNGPATCAQLCQPYGVAVDSAGNLYIADSINNRIRKVSKGVITTVAGNGTGGYSGDNGPATSAQLSRPEAVAVDSAGNLYIADTSNLRIRKVSDGVITTVAGSGLNPVTNLGDGGPAIKAGFRPNDITVDSAGNLYIADTGDSRIRKVSSGVITTVAGNGTKGYSGDNGPATSAQLYNPRGIAVDSAGNLYIADQSNLRIRKVSNGVITTVAGTGRSGYSGDNGPATSAALSSPNRVAVDSAGSLYIADSGYPRIRKVSNGVITTVAGNGTPGYSGDNGPATNAQLSSADGFALDAMGNIYLTHSSSQRVRILTSGADDGAAPLATVSAASFAPCVPLAPGVIAAGYGTNLVSTIEIAPATGPLPTVLGQTSVTIRDSAGLQRTAPLWFVSPSQINYYIPDETALGLATITVMRNLQTVVTGTLQINTVAPGLFTMNANGQGVPAALAIFVKGDGSQTWQYVFNSGCAVGSCQPVPLDLGAATDQVFLQLYGTGVRGRSSLAGMSATIGGVSAPVEYAGAVAGMIGLDQVNLRVPRSLVGRGEVAVVLTVDGKPANAVQVNIK